MVYNDDNTLAMVRVKYGKCKTSAGGGEETLSRCEIHTIQHLWHLKVCLTVSDWKLNFF